MEKLRTINEAITEIKAEDPNCALTPWALRQLVKAGEIPALNIGSKQLVSLEAVERFVNAQFER